MVRHDVQNASKVKALRAHSKLAEAPFRFWKRRFRKVNAPIIMAMVSTRDVQTSEFHFLFYLNPKGLLVISL